MPLNRSKSRLRFEGEGDEQPGRGDERAIEMAAMRMLAGRELSAGDIRRKLKEKRFESAPVELVIERLQAKGMLSDDRFVGAFIRQHSLRGHGPGRIRVELRQRGVAPETIDSQLRSAEVDWDAIATQVRERKFRAVPRSGAERAKQSRFLQYRGFSTEQIRAAMAAPSASGGSDADADPVAEVD
jgi:regulatory protein